MAQNKHNNQRKVFAMRTLAMTLFMVLFTQFAQAQRLTLKMTNGTREVPSGGFNFYDSGGPLLYTPGTPEADEYNWTTWYQHNESYTLILENPDGYGIEVEFEKLLINNDTLWFYEGEGINENNLIGSFCNNEYSSAFCSSSNKMKVVSHGNMTIRFKSDGRWRDEGWEAVVNNLTANDGSNPYAMQPPVAVMAACDEQMRLIPTCWDENPSQSGFQLQYRIGASGDFTNYAEGSWIDLNSQTFDLTVYTRTIANDPESTTTPPAIIASRTASYTFSEIKVPGHPGATQNVSSNTVTAFFPEKPNDVNDTYYIRWIINNNSNGSTENPNVWPVDGHEFQQPSNTSHEVPAGVIDYTNVTLGKPFYIHLATRGTTCPDLFSEVETVPVNMIYVPMPTITFVTNGNQGTTTLTCSLPGASIYYTTDGSEPDPTHVGGANDPTRLYEGTFSVLAGTTVKAIAVKTNYTNSAVASEIFIPGAENGNGQNGVYGNIVLLDDREDHSWSYYSDGDQPVHRLKPADVKISYKGYGEATMTDDSHTGDSGLGTDDFTEDVDAETVAVGPNDPGYEFIYLKTLENAKEDGSGDYPYTLIPNPFSKRPTFESGGSIPEPTIETIQVVNGSGNANYTPMNIPNANNGFKSEYIIPASYFTTAGINSGDKLTSITLYQNNTGNWTATNLTIKLQNSTTNNYGNNTGFLADNGTTVYTIATYSSGSQTSHTFNFSSPFEYDGNNVIIQISSGHNGTAVNNLTWKGIASTSGDRYSWYAYNRNAQDNNYSTSGGRQRFLPNTTFTVQKNNSATSDKYRGFYAWRVKNLSNGLTIKRANGTAVGKGGIINAEEEIVFLTQNPYGNEVEFEALWAQAYVVTSNTDTGLHAGVSYERNFIVGTQAARVGVPVTYSSYYPDGTSAGTASVSGMDCNADTKFEYMTISGGTFTSNNYYLCMGRGLTGTASRLRGIGAASSDLNYTLRVESGIYTNFSFVNEQGNGNVSGRYLVKAIMGCDYDRANNKDNSKLSVSPNAQLFFSTNVTFNNSGNKDKKTFDCVFKSGSYQSGYWGNNVNNNGDYQHSAYLGQNGAGNTYPGMRYVTVEGGEFGTICGGRGVGSESTTYASPEVVTFDLRIKGGLLHGCVYGAAADNPSIGSRRIVITGGEIRSWVAAGCNGTGSTSGTGATNGDSYVYVGGDAVIGGNNASVINGTAGGQVFGAGRGLEGRAGSINTSNVVIADNANISNPGTTGVLGGNVYGGGFNSYIVNVSNVYIVGGTIQRSVFGGSYGNGTAIPTSNVYIKGGIVNGSVYGGSNNIGTITNSNVTMTGGETKNVFGGGYGSNTIIATSTTVQISGGTLKYNLKSDSTTDYENGNVYGGGDAGTVTGNTSVSVSGGTLYNVYGAGKGATGVTALISGQTKVNVSGGTLYNVYGGGEAGNVEVSSGVASTVTIQGGTIKEDVFGGGRLGKTKGNVVVNVYDGSNITGSVYGGAFGTRGSVYIEGTHTVNITGGNIYTNVYGGSRNADDAITFNPSAGASDPVNRVNISGGHVYYQVFAGGYFGHTYGSVYAFVGQNAIHNAPNAAPTPQVGYNAVALLIDGSVWAGADFGNFDGTEFGEATIEGYSHVYIDGTGYNTISTKPSDAGYMNIGSSVLGTGTSCYAGLLGSNLIFRNYGQPVETSQGKDDDFVEPYTSATRHLKSIQFFNIIDIDNTHLHLIGQGRINSLMSTEKYAAYDIKEVLRMVNGSSFFIDFPVDQMKKLGSYVCGNVYATSPTFTVVDYGDLSPNNGKDNKFRVNNGSYLNVKYAGAYNPTPSQTGWDYGELEGFFYMMTDGENHTCAYARPKQSSDDGNTIPYAYDNPNDGGFRSYNPSENIFTAGTYASGSWTAAPGTGTPGVQMPYENHTLATKYGELYFRIWRYGGIYSYRQGIFDAVAQTTAGYSTADVVISLPAQRGSGSYFRIKVENGFPLIDYGDDVLTVNAGVYNSTNGTPLSNGWMNYDGDDFVEGQGASDMGTALDPLTQNPNVNFGLVAIPQGSLAGGQNTNWLICNDASDTGEALTTMSWTNNDNVNNPSILFRLTYNNALTNNATWDPIVIIFEQCDASGHVKDEIEVALSVSTVTTINQDFSTQVFAMMNGTGDQTATYTAKVVLPGFVPFVDELGQLSDWTFVDAVWTEAEGEFENAWKSGSGFYHSGDPHNDEFSMEIVPSANFDNTVGWNSYVDTKYDLKNLHDNHLTPHMAFTDGRNNTAFDFILHYDGAANCDDAKKKLGELKVTLHFTNLATSTAADHGRDLVITIEVFRRGVGNNYYIDGVNGNNFFDGDRPDAAKLTLSGVFNRTSYTPGDNIFIVNTVTAEGATALDWNGEQYGQVIIYRYPGGHSLKKDDTGTQAGRDYYAAYSEPVGDIPAYNPDNVGFAGTLVNVKKGMDIHGIILDGAYNIVHTTNPNTTLVPNVSRYQTPTAPLIYIEEEGVLNLYAGSKLQWNYTNSNGGAVYNAGMMIVRNGSDIVNNMLLADTYNGGGVYVEDGATLIVSDNININNNYQVTNTKNNNVYLEGANSVIQVGTTNPSDGIDPLENHLTDGTNLKSAKIGVTKSAWPDNYSYTPIAYSDGGGSTYLGNLIPDNPDGTPARDYIIFDDNLVYKVVTLNNTPAYQPSTDYLFWVGTWVTAQYWNPYFSGPDATGYTPYMTAAQLKDIHTPQQLAWVISLANGENGVDINNANYKITPIEVTADIDMSANIWVPIGNSAIPFGGNFNANGHVIKGVKSSLNDENMGMFGVISSKVNISNMILSVNFSGGSSTRMGSVAALMTGGTIKNVETAGVITGTSSTTAIGGIVGEKTNGTIQSSFAVNTMSAASPNTNMGGLVGSNIGNLVNSYANVTMSGNAKIGGLAGVNKGNIENCYAVMGRLPYPAFAHQNDGTIKFCYADHDNGYKEEGSAPTGHGLYNWEVKDRKELGYMYYDDNGITLEAGQSNPYVADRIIYNEEDDEEGLEHARIKMWDGLLSTLNQWVAGHSGYTKWLRPTTKDINGDLPVLAFPSDNSLATTDGKFLHYGSQVNGNGIDNLLTTFNDNRENAAKPEAYIFLYDNATDVENVPASNVSVFINENACLLQKTGSTQGNFINTTVGITFDNSWQQAHAYPGGSEAPELTYDWHMMSTPLRDAKIGTTYSHVEGSSYTPDTDSTFQKSPADIESLTDSYFPNGLLSQNTVTWDFYSFFEPEYHWINLKRNKNNHFHQDAYEDVVQEGIPYQEDVMGSNYRHYQIDYTENDQVDTKATSGDDGCVFTPGKGYLMAISMDSYMSSTGTLNNGNADITVPLTYQSEKPDEKGYNMLGNPYQAYLDMVDFFATNTSLNNSYWVYIAEEDGYVAGNCKASTNYALPSKTLHPHQAFFVKTEAKIDATFNYDMAKEKPADNFSYFRGKIDYPLVNLFACNEQGAKDLTVIEVNRPMLDGSPKMRAMNTTNFELFTRTNGKDYSILFTEEGTERVAVGFKTKADGVYTLKWDTQNGNFDYLRLIDNITGTERDMLATDHYSFEAHATDMSTRFYVVFKGDKNSNETEGNFAFFNGNEWIVNGEGTLQLIDVMGRIIYSEYLPGDISRVEFDNFTKGVYMLRLVDGNNTLQVQKIVIQ